MPISFSCGQCRKDYVVSDGLAGKKAVCKQCGNRMVVPGAAVSGSGFAPQSQSSSGSAPTRPVAMAQPVSTPRAIPKAKRVEPENDVYGFNEAPSALPPLMPLPGAPSESADPPVRKKKKKPGFFSTAGPKKSVGSYGRGGGLSGGGLIGLLVMVGLGIFGAVMGFGLSSKSDVESILTRQLDLGDEFIAALESVNSVDTARVASPKIQDILRRMTDNLQQNRNKKAKQSDIAEVVARLKPRDEQQNARAFAATSRIRMIPGALQALNMEAALMRVAALQAELQREAQAQGLHVN